MSSAAICRRTADLLSVAPAAAPSALIGFDGFIDTIANAVGRRRSAEPADYERVPTIAALAAHLAAAAGRSANLELRATDVRAGGNGPNMAAAMAALGAPVDFVGAIAAQPGGAAVHARFAAFARVCRSVIAISPPGETDALEFDDGKLMLNWPASLDALTWEAVLAAVGEASLRSMLDASPLLAAVNWTNCPGLPGIWRGLPTLGATGPREVFVDICNPARRGDDDVRTLITDLRALDRWRPLTLGVNIAEADRLLSVMSTGSKSPIAASRHGLRQGAEHLRAALGIARVLIHAREGAAAAEANQAVSIENAVIARPVISTGAGDHFNAGFATARLLGLPLDAATACGCGVASSFIATGRSPTRTDLVAWLRRA